MSFLPDWHRHTLTGLCRPRRGLFGRVVMQVHVKIESLDPMPRTPPMPPLATEKDGKRYEADCRAYRTEPHDPKVLGTWYEWRDAKMNDFVLKTPQATTLSLEQQ